MKFEISFFFEAPSVNNVQYHHNKLLGLLGTSFSIHIFI